MNDFKLFRHFINSMKNPFVFVDTNHIIQYMYPAAVKHYKEGEALLGTNIMDCHNKVSQQMMLEIFAEMKSNGLDERLITDNEKYRIYMRAVRDDSGILLGYYERYEPPVTEKT